MNLALNSKLHHDLQRLWGRHTRKSVNHRFSGKASNRSFVSNFVPKLARKGSSEHNRGEQLTAARLVSSETELPEKEKDTTTAPKGAQELSGRRQQAERCDRTAAGRVYAELKQTHKAPLGWLSSGRACCRLLSNRLQSLGLSGHCNRKYNYSDSVD